MSVLLNQPAVHSGELAGGRYMAVTVAFDVDDISHVIGAMLKVKLTLEHLNFYDLLNFFIFYLFNFP